MKRVYRMSVLNVLCNIILNACKYLYIIIQEHQVE